MKTPDKGCEEKEIRPDNNTKHNQLENLMQKPEQHFRWPPDSCNEAKRPAARMLKSWEMEKEKCCRSMQTLRTFLRPAFALFILSLQTRTRTLLSSHPIP